MFSQNKNGIEIKWIKFPKSSTGDSTYFAPELECRGPKCFPPVILTHFGRPQAKNIGSVFLTKVRPEPGIGHLEIQPIHILKFFRRRECIAPELEGKGPECVPFGSVFLTRVQPGESNFQNLPLERVFPSGTRRRWSRMFPFYTFCSPIGGKVQSGLFDQGTTILVKFPKSSTVKLNTHNHIITWTQHSMS